MNNFHRVFCVLLVILMFIQPVLAVDLDWLFGRRVSPVPLDTDMFPDASGISSIPRNSHPVPLRDATVPIKPYSLTDPVPKFLKLNQADEPVSIYGCSPQYINASGSILDIYLQHWKPDSTYRFNFTYPYQGSSITFSLPNDSQYVYQNEDDPDDPKNGMLVCAVRAPPQRLPMGTIDDCVLQGVANHFGQTTYLSYYGALIGLHLVSTDVPIIDDVSLIRTSGRAYNLNFSVYDPGSYSAVPSRTLTFQVDPDGMIQHWKNGQLSYECASISHAGASLFNRGEVKTIQLSFSVNVSLKYLDSADRVVIPLSWREGTSYDWRYECSIEILRTGDPNNLILKANDYAINAGDPTYLTAEFVNNYTGAVFNNVGIDLHFDSGGGYLEDTMVTGAVKTVNWPADYPKNWTIRATEPVTGIQSDPITVQIRGPAPNTYNLGIGSFSTHNVTVNPADAVNFVSRLYWSFDPTKYIRGNPANITILDPEGAVYRVIPYLTGNDPSYTFGSEAPAGDYIAYARSSVPDVYDLTSNGVVITLEGLSPDTLELDVEPTELYGGESLSITPNLYRADDPDHPVQGVYVNLYNNKSSAVLPIMTGVTTPVSTAGGTDVAIDASFWVTYQDLTSNVVTVHILPRPVPPPTGVLPTYPVPTGTPVKQIDRTPGLLDWTRWLIWNPPTPTPTPPPNDDSPLAGTVYAVPNVAGSVHDFVWGLSQWIPTPNGVYLFMRGSGGQVPVNVTDTTMRQVEIEAEDDTNPLLFILHGCQAIADAESGFMHYITSLVQCNPYYQLSHGLSIILTEIVPGFVWNILAVFIILGSAYPVAKYVLFSK